MKNDPDEARPKGTSDAHDDLAEMLTMLETPERVGDVAEFESRIDDRLQPVSDNGAVHCLEPGARPDCDALDANHRANQASNRNLRLVAGHEPYHTDESAEGHRCQ
jgi:hypothetical protein